MPPMHSLLPERDKHMSEQKKSFMEELDSWTEENVIEDLLASDPNLPEDWERAVEGVKRAIRAKVLESYRNGQKKLGEGAQAPASPQKGAHKWK